MNTEQTQQPDEKTTAILSYITIIGWIIAYTQLGKNKSQFTLFHIRQSLFLMLCALGICIVQISFTCVPYLGRIISISFSFVLVGFLVLWIIGLINAVNGEQKPLPIFGNKAQELLKGIGN
jgi:uncharacterized membrane protein